MFCPKCGKENPDGARFCAGCGKAFEATAPAAPVQETVVTEAPVTPAQTIPSTSAPTMPSSTESFMDKVKTLWAKKEVKIGVAIAAVAIIAIILLCGGGGGASSPEGAVENFVEATMDCDVEGMIECMPPQVSDKMLDMLNMTGMGIGMIEQQMRQEMPADFSYRILGKEKMSKDRIERYESELSSQASQFGGTDTEVRIEEGYYVEIEIFADGDSSDEDLPVGKINGKWYILETDIM